MSFIKEDHGDQGDDIINIQHGLMSTYGSNHPNNYDNRPNVQEQISRGVLQLFQNLGNKLDRTIDLLGNQLVAQNTNIVEHTRLIANIQHDHMNLHANVEELQGGQRELRSRQSEVERENSKTRIFLEQIKKQVAQLEAYNNKPEQGGNNKVGQGRGGNNNRNRKRQVVQCKFCQTRLLKCSLERHQKNTRKCLQVQEILKKGTFGTDLN